MRLGAHDIEERARWLLPMRWIACAGVLAATWIASFALGLPGDVLPLYAVAGGMMVYNLALEVVYRGRRAQRHTRSSAERLIVLQISLDLISLTLLLYFAGLPYNPFIVYYVFHVLIASMLIPGRTPYLLALEALVLLGTVLLLQGLGLLPFRPELLGLHSRPAAPDENGTRPFHLLAVFVAVASMLGITAYIATSVTRYLAGVQEQIRQHEKMLGIGQLVAGFSHQISNPLDGLQNGLRQIGTAVRGDSMLEDIIPRMQSALERIEKVARRLQEFARPHGMELQECDVNRAADATLQLLARTLTERGVTLEADLRPVPGAWADPYSVEEVVFNLCTNALDAMPRGGALRVRTFRTDRPDISTNGCLVIEVADSGPGIASDQLEKVFEPFYTTKSQSGGTGLGLSLCRMLLSEMGGRIEVESTLQKGSTFRVLLAQAR